MNPEKAENSISICRMLPIILAASITILTVTIASAGQDETVVKYNGLFTSKGFDDDGDGRFDCIIVNVGVSVIQAGEYSVSGRLFDSQGDEMRQVLPEKRHLSIGAKMTPLKFYGMNRTGSYYLRNLTLCDEGGKVLDRLDQAYVTDRYFNIDQSPQYANLTGEYLDWGLDTDYDGKYEFLAVDANVEVLFPGEYTLTGYLLSQDEKEIAWAIDSNFLQPGLRTMHLAFDGRPIEESGIDGPYTLGKLFLTGQNLTVKDVKERAYRTGDYSCRDFCSADKSVGEKAVRGKGYGELLLSVNICTTVPVSSGTYSYDLMGINIPPISTPWKVNGSRYGYSYDIPGIFMPAKPNDFAVQASGAKDLNVGLKKLPVPGKNEYTRIWVTSRAKADENGTATAKSDLLSPGNYHAKIFGDAGENVSAVEILMTVEKKLIVNGEFDLRINTSGFPPGKYSIQAEALNGTFELEEISMQV